MQCPVCKVELTMADRQGIEIDYCPKCRGVWLDRGELDKIIERSAEHEQRTMPSAARRETPSDRRPPEFYPANDEYDAKRKNDTRYQDDRYHDPYHDERYRDSDRPYEQRRKRSFLDDVFDIFD